MISKLNTSKQNRNVAHVGPGFCGWEDTPL